MYDTYNKEDRAKDRQADTYTRMHSMRICMYPLHLIHSENEIGWKFVIIYSHYSFIYICCCCCCSFFHVYFAISLMNHSFSVLLKLADWPGWGITSRYLNTLYRLVFWLENVNKMFNVGTCAISHCEFNASIYFCTNVCM